MNKKLLKENEKRVHFLFFATWIRWHLTSFGNRNSANGLCCELHRIESYSCTASQQMAYAVCYAHIILKNFNFKIAFFTCEQNNVQRLSYLTEILKWLFIFLFDCLSHFNYYFFSLEQMIILWIRAFVVGRNHFCVLCDIEN